MPGFFIISLNTVQSGKHCTVTDAPRLQFLQVLRYLQQSFRNFWSAFNEIEIEWVFTLCTSCSCSVLFCFSFLALLGKGVANKLFWKDCYS